MQISQGNGINKQEDQHMLSSVKHSTHGSLVKYYWVLQNAFEENAKSCFQIQVFPITLHALPQDFILSWLHHSSSWELSERES